MQPLPGEQLTSARKRLVAATGCSLGPLVAVATILESPSVLVTILVLGLGVTWSLLCFVALIVRAPTDSPTERLCWLLERLCWLLTAANGRQNS